jgi:hypothetical protein
MQAADYTGVFGSDNLEEELCEAALRQTVKDIVCLIGSLHGRDV